MTNAPSRADIDSVPRRLLDPQTRLDGFSGQVIRLACSSD